MLLLYHTLQPYHSSSPTLLLKTPANQMGCCISKCRPENNKLCLEEQPHHQQFSHVQDKLVISQAPSPPPQPLLPTISPSIIPHRHPKYKISTSPPSPTSSSTSSVSSFTCTASSNTISSASSLSSASSATLKDRSFSNEFLLSCYRENPHISRINSLREATIPLTNNATEPKPSPPPPKKPSSPKQNVVGKPCSPKQNVVGSFSTMPQKRVRSNSPTNLTRQKSFRKEQPDRTVRTLGSTSPGRRFSNGGSSPSPTTIMDTSVSKRIMNSSTRVSSVYYSRSVSSSLRKEASVNKAASSPNNNNSSLGRLQYSGLRHRETRTLRVGSKIDETAAKDAISNHDMDIDLTEDIDNPLISLDCFIFL